MESIKSFNAYEPTVTQSVGQHVFKGTNAALGQSSGAAVTFSKEFITTCEQKAGVPKNNHVTHSLRSYYIT